MCVYAIYKIDTKWLRKWMDAGRVLGDPVGRGSAVGGHRQERVQLHGSSLRRRRGHRGLRLKGIRKETEKADGKKDAARERLRVGQKAPPTRRRRRREEEGEHAADQAEDEDDDEEDDLESV